MLSKLKKLRIDDGFKTFPTNINEWIIRFNGFRELLRDFTTERETWLRETNEDRVRPPLKKNLIDICKKYNIKNYSTLKCNDLEEKVKTFFSEKMNEYCIKHNQLWMYLKTCHLYIRQLQGYTTASPEFVHLFGPGETPVTTKLEIVSFDYNPNLVSLDSKDIVEVICKNLSIGDIGRLMQSCKKYYRSITNNNALWLYLCQRDLCIRRGRECPNWFLFYKNWFTKKTNSSRWFTRDVSGKLYDVFDGKLGIFHLDTICIEIEEKGFVLSRHDMCEKTFRTFRSWINGIISEFRFNGDQFAICHKKTSTYTIIQKVDGELIVKGRGSGIPLNDNFRTKFVRPKEIILTGYHNDFTVSSHIIWFNNVWSKRRFSFDPHFGVVFDKDNLCIPDSKIVYRWGNYYYGLRKVLDTLFFVYCCSMENHYMFRYLSDPIQFDDREVPERLWIDSERIFIQTNKNLWILK